LGGFSQVNAEYGAVKNLPTDQGRVQGKGAAAPSSALALPGKCCCPSLDDSP
jgi:hypothetical protein